MPCEDYWPKIVEVCRRYGVLVIADEVMTGFGRTGRWFGVDHWGVRPDIVTAGKGTTSGYVPFGFAAASGEVYETVAAKGFVHGFTWSHNALGAAVALATSAAAARRRSGRPRRDLGAKIKGDLTAALDDVPVVGDVRGLGMMIGIELVTDRDSKEPFPRPEQVTERVVAAAREAGLLLYSSTGHVDGANGDLHHARPAVHPDRRRRRRAGRADGRARSASVRVSGARRARSCAPDARARTTTGRSIRSVPIACCSRGT